MAFALAEVLYVEDQPLVSAVVLLELEQANLRVTTVPNGERCLALARKRKFDLILLDQRLPGMDGLEVCRRLKSDPRLKKIPVIFFTAFPSDHEEDEARRLGAVDYVVKGYPEARLAARILAKVELARNHTARPSRKTAPSQPDAQPSSAEN